VAREVGIEGKLGGQANVPGASGTWKDLTGNVNRLAGNLTTQVRAIANVATAVTKGDLTRTITVEAQGELMELKNNVNQMISNLRETTQKNMEQDWLKTNLARFSGMMQGQKSLESVSRLIMSELTPLVSAQHGVFFVAEKDEAETVLRLLASYAYRQRKNVSNEFRFGEGLVGQSALERKSILLTNVPDDYIQVNSGLGQAPPLNIVVLPVLFEDEVKGVIELASFNPFSDIHLIFLEQLAESIGVVLNMISANMQTESLLTQSQALTEELQNNSEALRQQQDELRRSNAELEAQAMSLKASEELLKAQQEELQQINEELEEKASLLAEQNQKIEQKNREIDMARVAIEEKAEQLALSSKYKSEFLANMSHELRTPLNSLLILAKLLADNKEENLTQKQIEFAETIHSAGSDLLNLINEVLDLSKVESGKMDINPVEVELDDVFDYLDRNFRAVAQQKDLEYTLTRDDEVPDILQTDGQRLQQILKNLISNAFKFTEIGSVNVRARIVEPGTIRFRNEALEQAGTVIAFDVADTGIGIPYDKQRLIFEAFQQVDGTTNRKYGGTGLGLSISRELARLLGGEIQLSSEISEGSVFSLLLPSRYLDVADQIVASDVAERAVYSRAGIDETALEEAVPEVDDADLNRNELEDDRETIESGDRAILIVEDDEAFARILLDMAREKNFKGIVALRGDVGLALAHEFQPDAILLDIQLPVIDGWAVLERLKNHRDTRHIPVHILSATAMEQRGMRLGAMAYLEKPVSKEALDDAFQHISDFIDRGVRSLLIVEDDETQRASMRELIGEDDVDTVTVGSAEEALEQLESKQFDCMVLDLNLPEMTGFDLLEKVKGREKLHNLPIIIYTGRQLSQQEETRLKKYAETIIIKDARSPERLLDETALFLHRVEANLPEAKRRVLEQLHTADAVFRDKKILVVDDDVRNIFAITSVLEGQGMTVLYAENGRDALAKLEESPGVDLVLMDVMMPEMDGYETMQAIRAMEDLRGLPIIALTAKAMKGDREKCIAAGASDYITKPVDPDQLLSLMRVWLYR
jgi:CheY-like chemotaxis protein/signal transduction histidine kinase/HAMP domain-containing protein